MKTNMGQKWYQSTAYDFPVFRWIFFILVARGTPLQHNFAAYATLIWSRPQQSAT
jgi:hypothetical protein